MVAVVSEKAGHAPFSSSLPPLPWSLSAFNRKKTLTPLKIQQDGEKSKDSADPHKKVLEGFTSWDDLKIVVNDLISRSSSKSFADRGINRPNGGSSSEVMVNPRNSYICF